MEGAVGVLLPIGPEALPDEDLGIVEQEAPEGNVVAVDGALLSTAGANIFFEREVALADTGLSLIHI